MLTTSEPGGARRLGTCRRDAQAVLNGHPQRLLQCIDDTFADSARINADFKKVDEAMNGVS